LKPSNAGFNSANATFKPAAWGYDLMTLHLH
jgi:hypothetical protein